MGVKKSKPISKDVPLGAVTVELTEKEVLTALGGFVGQKVGDNFEAQAELEVITRPGRAPRFIFSYWRPS